MNKNNIVPFPRDKKEKRNLINKKNNKKQAKKPIKNNKWADFIGLLIFIIFFSYIAAQSVKGFSSTGTFFFMVFWLSFFAFVVKQFSLRN